MIKNGQNSFNIIVVEPKVTKMLILGAWYSTVPLSLCPSIRTYVGLIHIIEDDNEYESFFIDPTSFAA